MFTFDELVPLSVMLISSRKTMKILATSGTWHIFPWLAHFIILAQQILNSTNESKGANNPDIYLKSPGIIRRHGYTCETHTVETQDGYMIGLHRIPHGRKEKNISGSKTPAIYLQHGLLGSSSDWLIAGPDKALAFLLADAGYDVWIGNARGNEYSLGHKTLSTDNPDFWDFSWDEIALYDLPATVNHVLNTTGMSKLTFVGHSMGGSLPLALVSALPEFTEKINIIISLAPLVYCTHMISPLRLLYSDPALLEKLNKVASTGNPVVSTNILRYFDEKFCTTNKQNELLCEKPLFLLGGYDTEQMEKSLIPVIETHFPSSTGVRVTVQFAQQHVSGRFCRYDHGDDKNLKLYNSTLPPAYPLEKVKIPVAVLYAENDWFVNPLDAEKAAVSLPNVVQKYLIPDPKFNHFDYLYGKDAPSLVYSKIFDLLNKYAPSAKPFKKKWKIPKKLKKYQQKERKNELN